MTDTEFSKLQEIESGTWCIPDKDIRNEKAMREVARYPLMAKQMGLRTCIDTSDMIVFDIGAGPLQGVSSVIPCKRRVPVDPNKGAYSKYFNVSNYLDTPAERMKTMLAIPDLIISTNCIDHFQNPLDFLHDLKRYMKYGAYFAHYHAIDNAFQHPHPAHKFNLNEDIIKEALYDDFELVWQMNYKDDGLVYGWLKEKSFCQLWRRTTQPKEIEP
jgi:hypothetical protein